MNAKLPKSHHTLFYSLICCVAFLIPSFAYNLRLSAIAAVEYKNSLNLCHTNVATLEHKLSISLNNNLESSLQFHNTASTPFQYSTHSHHDNTFHIHLDPSHVFDFLKHSNSTSYTTSEHENKAQQDNREPAPKSKSKSESESKPKFKSKSKSKSKMSSKTTFNASHNEHKEPQSLNEFICIVHDESFQYNFSLSSCYQLFHLVHDYKNKILYAQDICSLKAIIQELVPWLCHIITTLSSINVANKEVYDIDILQQICVQSQINLDLLLPPIEMCLVKEYIYNL